MKIWIPEGAAHERFWVRATQPISIAGNRVRRDSEMTSDNVAYRALVRFKRYPSKWSVIATGRGLSKRAALIEWAKEA